MRMKFCAMAISKKQAIGFFLPLFIAAIYYVFMHHAHSDQYDDLDNFGRSTQATIIAKQLIRRGSDRPSFYYQMKVGFTVGEKMLRGNVMVSKTFYDRYETTDSVPIRYLPEDPSIRELDPAMRNQSKNNTLTIVLIFVFISTINLFMLTEMGNKKHQ